MIQSQVAHFLTVAGQVKALKGIQTRRIISTYGEPTISRKLTLRNKKGWLIFWQVETLDLTPVLLPKCRLDELLVAVREGDVVVVIQLARLGRNTAHTIQLVEEFNRRGVHFRVRDLGIDSRTPAGKMIIGVFSSFNQYEREDNRQKSLAGIALAKQQGKHLGRPAGRVSRRWPRHQNGGCQ